MYNCNYSVVFRGICVCLSVYNYLRHTLNARVTYTIADIHTQFGEFIEHVSV